MNLREVVLRCAIAALAINIAKGQSADKTNDLYEKLLKNYRSSARPVLDQTSTVHVNVTLSVGGIQRYDDITGQLTFLSYIKFDWTEERMTWNPAAYEGTRSVVFDYEEVWKPEVTMLNIQDPGKSPGRHSQVVRIASDGSASMASLDLLQTICSVDMTNYPFDTQLCDISIVPWGYFESEVKLNLKDIQDTDKAFEPQFAENSAWKLMSTEVIIRRGPVSNIDLMLKIRRRFTYTFVNFLIPIYMLGFLNMWVFWLPPESGERVSYCITVFLSFAVYMTILSDVLETGSEPLPILNYLMLVMLFYSVAILFSTIMSLNWYNNVKKKPVPQYAKHITYMLSWQCLRKVHPQVDIVTEIHTSKTGLTEEDINDSSGKSVTCKKVSRETCKNDCENTDITWTLVGETFDTYMLVFFLVWWIVAVTIQVMVAVK